MTVTSNCTSICTLSIDAPVGSDAFAVGLFDWQNGSGNELSKGAATFDVLPDVANSFSMTFDGVPAAISMTIDRQPVVHTPSTEHLTVTVEDADGNVIVGPGAFPTVALTNDDQSGTVILGANQVSLQNASVSLAYDGAWISTGNASANITASIAGTSVTNTFAVSPQPLYATYSGAYSSVTNGVDMTKGPDGALWFIGNRNEIDRITTSGVLSRYSAPSTNIPFAITAGPDGALWFTDGEVGATDVGRITTSGTVSTCSGAASATTIVSGPDGNLWTGDAATGAIQRISPSCAVQTFADPAAADIQDITSGPDGALWFTADGSADGTIGRITTTGAESNFTIPGGPYPSGIVSGSDGYLWFVENNYGEVGRVSTSGNISLFNRPPGGQEASGSIVVGPDGAMWFNMSGGIGRISESGQYTFYRVGDTPRGLTLGPDNALWGIDFFNGNVIRISI